MNVNIGILGPGNIANVFAKATRFCHSLTLKAVASRDLERSQNFAKEYDIERAYGSYEELLQDEDVQAVYISTPHSNHYELTKACLMAGKAVMCEKPFVLSVEECTELIELAKSKNILLMEAMWTRCLPTIRTAHQWVEEGLIGDLKLIDASFSYYSEINPESRIYNKALAGGALYDVGVYVVSFAMDFANSPIKEMNSMADFGATDVDEISLVNIKFQNNILASLSSGVRARTEQNGILYGTKGYIKLPIFWGGTEAVAYDNKDNVIAEFKSDYTEMYDGFKFEIQHFVDLFLDGKKESPIIPFDYNISCTKLFEDFFKANS